MQNKKSLFVVRSIALITAATAIYVLFDPIVYKAAGLWRAFLGLFLSDFRGPNSSWWLWLLGNLFNSLFILKLISAYGLFTLKSWAKKLSIIVLSADFLFRFAYMIHFWVYYFTHPRPVHIPYVPKEGEWHISVVVRISMWPTEIIMMISLISIIILFQKPIKKLFRKVPISNSTDNLA